MTIIQQLRLFAKAHDTGSVGLILQDELKRGGYHCTPRNSLSFAHTGGDGVHFSILTGFKEDESPVVMTVPMSFGNENMVIARSPKDFLKLGCRFGFFSLEQLCYDFETAVQDIAHANMLEVEDETLVALSDEFALQPISGVAEYIERLKDEYLPLLEVKFD